MIAGLEAFNTTFLNDLTATENRITQTNKQLTSGIRVNEASDDPVAVSSILAYQSHIDHVTQVQTNLNLAGAQASTADGALAAAANLLDKAVAIASQGASSTSIGQTRTILAQQVQAIAQQFVALANTPISGRYVFGGDDPSTAPYTFDWSAPGGVIQNNTAGNTATLTNASGASILPNQTAQQIFDARNPDGTPATSNIFQNIYALGQALQNNDAAAAQAVALALKSSVTQLGLSTATNGNTISWIQQSQSDASTIQVTLSQELGQLRDTDVAHAATDLTLDQNALQAALAAHSSLNTKSLFSYLG